MPKTKGFTASQKDHIKAAYRHVHGDLCCMFPEYDEEQGWHNCGSKKDIHLHHVQPKGHYRRTTGRDPNFPSNGVPLCEQHHNGKGYEGTLDHRNEYVPVLHPDMAWARKHYSGKESNSYARVFRGREQRTMEGDTYWNGDFDDYFRRLAEDTLTRYAVEMGFEKGKK